LKETGDNDHHRFGTTHSKRAIGIGHSISVEGVLSMHCASYPFPTNSESIAVNHSLAFPLISITVLHFSPIFRLSPTSLPIPLAKPTKIPFIPRDLLNLVFSTDLHLLEDPISTSLQLVLLFYFDF
jgi:hypothetical protein